MSTNSEEKIRQCERDIDAAYKVLQTAQLEPAYALYFLLAAFDGFFLPYVIESVQERSEIEANSFSLYFKNVQEGFVHALRWITGKKGVPDLRSSENQRGINDAAELIQLGSVYNQVLNHFVLYSRGLIKAKYDESKNEIRFFGDAKSNDQLLGVYYHIDSLESQTGDSIERVSDSAQHLFRERALRVKHHCENGHIVIDDALSLSHPGIMGFAQQLIRRSKLFPSSTDLGSFILTEFDTYWATLFAWSHVSLLLYFERCKLGEEQSKCMPTQVVRCGDFLDNMVQLTGIAPGKVRAITDHLTYNSALGKPDVFLSPLLPGDKTVAWSPFAVILSKHQRNLLKSLARNKKTQDIAASIIGSREKEIGKEFVEFFDVAGEWRFCSFKKSKLMEDVEIDLIGQTPKHPAQILIVEIKGILGVDEMSEQLECNEKLIAAQRQVKRTIRIIKELPIPVKRKVFPRIDWGNVNNYYGAIITPDSEPTWNLPNRNIPAISIATVKARVQVSDLASPSKFVKAIKGRLWHIDKGNFQLKYSSLQIGGVKVSFPSFEFSARRGDLQ